MKTYSVIMEHKKTKRIMFLKVEDCVDMDDCITHVTAENPDYIIDRISPEN